MNAVVSQGRVFLSQRIAGPHRSAFLGNTVIRDAPVFLLPFDVSLLWAAYCMAKDDHISQDVLDQWCMALHRIPRQDKDYSAWSPSEALCHVKDWVN